MHRLLVHPHVSFAIVEGRPIFLDLRRDRYLALDGSAARAFEELLSTPPALVRDDLQAPLVATGLFTLGEGPCGVPPRVPPARRTLTADRRAPRLADLLSVAGLLARFGHSVRHRPLEEVIGEHRGRLSARSARLVGTPSALAQRFHHSRAWIPIRPSCLQDSLALQQWLASRGARAALVLGVKLNPFAAHAWVQHGELVLNDAADTVAAFTPILVIE